MKHKNLWGILLLFLAAFGFASCDKDDKVNISQLTGTWSVANDDPNLCVDGYVTYTFHADKTCDIYSYDALSNRDTTINRIYITSMDNRLITLFETSYACQKNGVYTHQYHILRLTSKEMKWENASPKDGNQMNVRLVKK